MEARLIAKRRVIKRIEINDTTGVIVAGGKLFHVNHHDLLDLCNAVEMIMLKLCGKVLRKEFRPVITDRAKLAGAKIKAGAYDLYDATEEGDAPCPPEQTCAVTEDVLHTHYLRVEINGEVWHSWFCRLDELVKCIYRIIREAQAAADPVLPGLPVTSRAPKQRVNLSPEVLH